MYTIYLVLAFEEGAEEEKDLKAIFPFTSLKEAMSYIEVYKDVADYELYVVTDTMKLA